MWKAVIAEIVNLTEKLFRIHNLSMSSLSCPSPWALFSKTDVTSFILFYYYAYLKLSLCKIWDEFILNIWRSFPSTLWCSNQFFVFFCPFHEKCTVYFGFIWPFTLKLHFRIPCTHLNTCIELDTILASNGKNKLVQEIKKVARSDTAHWLCTKNVILQVPYPISF